MDENQFTKLVNRYHYDGFNPYILYDTTVAQERKLIKALARIFEHPDWKKVDVVLEDVYNTDTDDSVRSCAACAMSALMHANNPTSFLYGTRTEMWNEDD